MTEMSISGEEDKEPVEPADPDFALHDQAFVHTSAIRKLKERRNLLSNLGPHRRALCARRDLEMRRQLCHMDKVSYLPFACFS